MKTEFVDLTWRITKHRNEMIVFLFDLLGEWEDNPDVSDDVEVCGITVGHMRRAWELTHPAPTESEARDE